MCLLIQDTDDFNSAYTAMMDFINKGENLPKMEEELRGRGVSYAFLALEPKSNT